LAADGANGIPLPGGPAIVGARHCFRRSLLHWLM
jgi:hypothetical protein